MKVEAVEVRGREGARIFAEAARTARAGDPSWVAPFAIETDALFRGDGTPFNRRNPHAFIVALSAGRPVGRVMAVDDRDHLATHGDGAAHFGFLEGVDEPQVFDALFGAAAEWARGRGLRRLEGPYSASINHEIGLLVAGDGRPSTFKTNDAPPHYAEHLTRLGFAGVRDLLAYEAETAESDFPERAGRILDRWPGRRRLVLRPFDPLRFGRSVRETNAVYADAWAGNWRAVAPPEEEARFIARLTLPWIRPSWLRVAAWDGRPIGILSMIPDLNEAAAGLDGRLLPFGWARYVRRLKISGVSRARIALIGVSRAYRGTRVGAMAATALLADAIENARRGRVKSVEISWMLADNAGVLNLVASLPARRTKTWRMFAKEI